MERTPKVPAEVASPRPTTSLLVLVAIGGCFLTVVVAFGGSSIGAAAAVPLVVLGLAVTGWSLVGAARRTGPVGRWGLAALAGVFALFVGLALGSWSYDERYFGDDALARLTGADVEPSAFWDVVMWVGAAMLFLGPILTVVSLIGLLVAGIRRPRSN